MQDMTQIWLVWYAQTKSKAFEALSPSILIKIPNKNIKIQFKMHWKVCKDGQLGIIVGKIIAIK